MPDSFAELFKASSFKNRMKAGSILTGMVVEITGDYVIVNAGLKSEGAVPIEEFKDENGETNVKIGDSVEVALDSIEDGFGETKLSREKALRERSWTVLERAQENDEIIKGNITGKVKGGFTVEVCDIRAFLPGSMVDVRPVRDTSYLEGKELEFKVIKLDQRRNNVVVSRRAVFESEYSSEREQLLKNLQEGQEIMGIVKNLTDYGAFLDLGGIDGLLHITDMAWKRVKHPSEVVEVGQEMQVKVLKFDRERNRISLGLKQLGEDPWVDLTRRYPEGSRLFGKVTNIADYGCFVEIEEGVEGLVHVSEMDWINRNVNPNKVVALGDEVEVMILDIDQERRRISLGIKQCKPNPYENFFESFNKGDKVAGTIKSITDFGIFIGLDGGIDGLIHLSDLSWNETGEEAVHNYKKGDEIEAVVLAVDAERERISLGLKQINWDPYGQFVADTPKGSIVKGIVKAINALYAIIDFGDNVSGVLYATDFSKNNVEDFCQDLREGDEVEAKLIGTDKKTRMLKLSITNDMTDSDALPETANFSSPRLGDIMDATVDKFLYTEALDTRNNGLIEVNNHYANHSTMLASFVGVEGSQIVVETSTGIRGVTDGNTTVEWSDDQQSDFSLNHKFLVLVLAIDIKRKSFIAKVVRTFNGKFSTNLEISTYKPVATDIRNVTTTEIVDTLSRYNLSANLVTTIKSVSVESRHSLNLEEIDKLLEQLSHNTIVLDWSHDTLFDLAKRNPTSLIACCIHKSSGTVKSFGEKIVYSSEGMIITPGYLDFLDPDGDDVGYDSDSMIFGGFHADFLIFGIVQ